MHEIGFLLHFSACLKAAVVLARLAGSFLVILSVIFYLRITGMNTLFLFEM